MFITNNKTPYIAETTVLLDKNGIKNAVTVVKASWIFHSDGRVLPAEEQAPLCYGDEYRGQPGKSSIKYTSDIVLEKKGTDIALNGHVYAPINKNVKKMDAALKVGPLLKRVRVFGDRFWKYNMGIVSRTSPVPFDKMPLVYERAFGGVDTFHKKEKKHGTCEENPVGVGFRMVKSKESIDGQPVPNIEDHKISMKNWNDKPKPAGFGFIAPSWAPRRQYSGTFDENWNENRMPLLPEDFDNRFNNAATPDLISDGFLKGTEPVTLFNLHPDGEKIQFSLPGIRISTAYIFEHQTYKPETVFDTLTIEPDQNRFTMVWRSCFSGPEKLSHLKQVNISYKENVDYEKTNKQS